jgi:hypothetical protein
MGIRKISWWHLAPVVFAIFTIRKDALERDICDCCSVEHAFLLTNNSFEEMVLDDSRFDQAHIPYNR